MTYKITYSKAFKKHYKKLSDVEKKQTKKKLEFFVENPTHPSLRTKKIQGVEDIWEADKHNIQKYSAYQLYLSYFNIFNSQILNISTPTF